MRIILFGATGKVGSRVLHEALARNHQVTAVVRQPPAMNSLPTAANIVVGTANELDQVVQLCCGNDLIINATRSPTNNIATVSKITQVLLQAARQTNSRLLIAGGAASLEVPDKQGTIVLDDPRYLKPSARSVAIASLQQYKLCRDNTDTNWTYLSPPAELFPGERTGLYRIGRDELLLDKHNRSWISMEDFAVALLDEAAQQRFKQSRFTVAY